VTTAQHEPERPGRLEAARERFALAFAFVTLAVRYWLAVYPHVLVRLRRTRARASAIPDPGLRALALASLQKHSNLEGAAAFAALVPRKTRRPAIRALLAFQSIYNYVDVLAEQPDVTTAAQALNAHLPLACALGAPPDIGPLYLKGRWLHDSGYLAELVVICRQALTELPAAAIVRAAALQSAREIAEFQAHSHPAATSQDLESWARRPHARSPQLGWRETAAARGSSLAVHALIAAAAERSLDPQTVPRLLAAYGGPIGALHSMLDSLVDQDEDARLGQTSLIALYDSPEHAETVLARTARLARTAARELPGGRRHAVLVAAMAASYLSDSRAQSPQAAPVAEAVRNAIGSLAAPAMAVFAVRRLACQRSRSSRIDAPQIDGRVEAELPSDTCAPAA
jgi:tetraprenyl-beta-curcumene synthase